ncbi:DUF6873 family GME fold protein [Peptostreptococcus equinus]|uniref:DUF6873 domain-containing protein n=1 Tax=Peptostreptococcus equinus TaxID=3003601 RepID=A0ABY7JSP0_9FIRM|nr:hypothetical protein [Peptostreptococcus sp. CBA3647]WAW15479.1 hypothetical protein O0R46_03270 [Peptostreptococcus sp. CBA3647]
MKNIIVDRRISKEIKSNLSSIGYNVIESYKHEYLYSAIESHVDICLFFDGKIFIASPESYEYYSIILKGQKIECGSTRLSKNYPKDVAYNVSYMGEYAIANIECTDKIVLEQLKKNGTKLIDINQGYANCSICQVDQKSLITSDKGIYKNVIEEGLDVLLIQAGHIDLFDMDYGFIGGASGKLGDETICFFGNIDLHPDGQSIRKFIEYRNKKIVCLSEGKLRDYGSCIVF